MNTISVNHNPFDLKWDKQPFYIVIKVWDSVQFLIHYQNVEFLYALSDVAKTKEFFFSFSSNIGISTFIQTTDGETWIEMDIVDFQSVKIILIRSDTFRSISLQFAFAYTSYLYATENDPKLNKVRKLSLLVI